ncbi:unnamed protein product, partial [Dibothriocephalus latus]
AFIRQARHLDFLSQYTTTFRFLKGLYAKVVECLVRVGINVFLRTSIESERMTELQNQPTFTESLEHWSSDRGYSSFHYPRYNLMSRNARCLLTCSAKRDETRLFGTLHNLAHSGIHTIHRLFSERFVWPSINTDIR